MRGPSKKWNTKWSSKPKRDTKLGPYNVLGSRIWPKRPSSTSKAPTRTPSQAAVARRIGAAPSRATSQSVVPPILAGAPAPSQEVGSPPSPTPGATPSSAPTGEYTAEQEAQDTLDQQYGPKIAALMRAKGSVGNEHKALTGATQQYGSGFDSKLSEIYDKLRAQLQEGYKVTGDSYTQAAGTVTDAHQAAGATTQAAVQAGQADLQGTAQNLGLEAGVTGAADPLQKFLALAQTQNSQNQAQSLSNLSANKAGALAFSQGGIDSAATEGAGARSALVKQVAGQLGNLNLQKLKTDGEIQGQLADLETQKAAALRTMVATIKSSREESEREAAKEEFARAIQQNTMDIQLAKLGLARDKQGFDQGMDEQEFGLKAADTAFDNSLAQERLGLTASGQALTARGQDIASRDRAAALKVQQQKAGLVRTGKPAWKGGKWSSTSGKTTGTKTKTEAEARRDTQALVLKSVKTGASKNTNASFNDITKSSATFTQALAKINGVDDKTYKKLGVSKKALTDWVRRYYSPNANEIRAASGKR